MDSGAPYSPFNRQRRGTEAPQFERTPIARKRPPPPADLGLPNGSFLQDLNGSFRKSVTDPPGPHSESGDEDNESVSDRGHDRRERARDRGTSNAAAGLYSLAQKVTSSVSSFASQHNPDAFHQLSDAEIEAEAMKEREHSRREAERILLQEAEERRRSEDLLAQQSNPHYLPPLRPRRSTIDILPPQPMMGGRATSPGQKGSWWSMAKQKLTPGKSQDEGPLTPAQAIMRDAKMREHDTSPTEDDMDDMRDAFRTRKQSWFSPKEKEKERERERAATVPNGPSPGSMPLPLSPPPINRGLSVSPRVAGSHAVSPVTPPRVPEASQTTQFNLSPTPAPRGLPRPVHERAPPTKAATAFSDAPSTYTQFHPVTGALDVAATLLTVATRFEKLEKWTVNHVRALEERMKDVERFLVEKETKEADVKRNLSLLRHNISDVQTLMTETAGALPAAVLSNLLMPRNREFDPSSDGAGGAGATSPSSHGAGESSYYSATGSPSIVPFNSFEPASRPSSAPRERSYTAESAAPSPYNQYTYHEREETERGPNGTVKPAASNGRGPLPYSPREQQTSDSKEEARSLAEQSYHPSADPYTPPSRSALSLVSASGSPVLPPPRAVSPLALSSMDLEEPRDYGISNYQRSRGESSSSAVASSSATNFNAGSGRTSVDDRATSPSFMNRSYTASPSTMQTLTAQPQFQNLSQSQSQTSLSAPSQTSMHAPLSPPQPPQQSTPNSRAGSRGNSVSPTPRKRYTVALSGRADGAVSPNAAGGMSPVGGVSPFPEPRDDDVVERVYGVGVSSGGGSGSGSTRMKVHTALFTSTTDSPTFDFESSSSLTSSLAASLRTPEPSSSTTARERLKKWSSTSVSGGESGTESDASPSHSHHTTSATTTTEPSPNSSFSVSAPPLSAEEKGKMRSLSYERVRIPTGARATSTVEEVTEPESEDGYDPEDKYGEVDADVDGDKRKSRDLPPLPESNNVSEKEQGEETDEDEDDSGGLFKVGSTPIALRRISSPPSSPTPPLTLAPASRPLPQRQSSSPTPLRPRTQTLPPTPSSLVNKVTLGGEGGAGSRSVSPALLPIKSSSGIPRGFGGLGPDVNPGIHGSVSSMASASTSTSSMVTTSSSGVTASTTSGSGRSISGSSDASGSYRTPAGGSSPNVRSSVISASSSSAAIDSNARTPRARPQTIIPPSSMHSSANSTTTIRRISPPPSSVLTTTIPLSAGGPMSSSQSSPGSDRDRSDLDVFASRSTSGGSSSSFIDPLLVRKREKERRSMEVKATALAVAKKATDTRAPGKKPPVNELVAFFQAAQD